MPSMVLQLIFSHQKEATSNGLKLQLQFGSDIFKHIMSVISFILIFVFTQVFLIPGAGQSCVSFPGQDLRHANMAPNLRKDP